MKISKMNFGSSFRFTPKQLNKIKKNQRVFVKTLTRYAGISEKNFIHLFYGSTDTLTVANSQDEIFLKICNTFKITPEKIS